MTRCSMVPTRLPNTTFEHRQSMNEEAYINRAIQELLHPSLEVTMQHLEVLQPEMKEGFPVVARVNSRLSENLALVYFAIQDERFFLVVNVEKGDDLTIHSIWVESGHRVYLTATSEDYDLARLSAFLNLPGLDGWSKGEPRRNGRSRHSFSRVCFEPNTNEAYDLEEKLIELLTALEKDAEGVVQLSKEAIAYISVVRHQYVSGNAGIHLEQETISRLSKLNLSLDIDTYIVGAPLKD